MSGCDDTLVLLYAYLDDVLDASSRAEIESHVGDCPDCRNRVDFEHSLLIHIRTRSKEEPLPVDLRRRLLECFDIDVADGTRRDEA
jgi:anti-sigma factor (TIGR02949 family)